VIDVSGGVVSTLNVLAALMPTWPFAFDCWACAV
jgi:hypothetical protein